MMITILDFVKFLLRQNPQGNAARLSLYHFLKHFYKGHEAFHPSIITGFYAFCLNFDFWQKDAAALSNEIRASLKAFEQEAKSDLGTDKMRHADEWILVPFPKLQDFADFLASYLKTQTKNFRIFQSKDKTTALIWKENSFEVHEYKAITSFHDGSFQPLAPISQLHYNMDLELLEGANQYISLGSHQIGYFQKQQQQYFVQNLKGYTLSPSDSQSIAKLQEIPSLFCALKRLEAFFILKKSDPIYLELENLLRKAQEILHTERPDRYRIGFLAHQKAKQAIENIFPDDKDLLLLLKDLTIQLQSLSSGRNHVSSLK